MPLRALFVLSAAAVIAIAGALFALSGDDDAAFSLEGVPDSELAARGIELFIPDGDPLITAEQAIDIGMRDRVSDNIHEPTLVHLVITAQPEINTLAWAIVFDKDVDRSFVSGPGNRNPTPMPSPTPANCGPPQPYVVAFIDAATADNILEFETERSSDLTPGETCPPTPIPLTPTLPPGARTAIELKGLPGDAFSSNVYLLAPNAGETPSISAREAIDIALQRKTGAVVREVVLAQLTQDGAGPLDNLVWAVNLDPASVQAEQPLGLFGAEYCPSTAHPKYAVVFIDAHSAKLVFDMQKTLLPPLAKDGDCPAVVPDDKDYPAPTQVPGFEATAP